MISAQVIELSDDGKLTIPKDIFKNLELTPQDKFIIVGEKNCIILKKIQILSPKERFQSVTDEVEKQFKEKGITKGDIKEAIDWARRQK